MQIQDKIMLLRRQKGMSQEELAAELGVSRQAVYKWESGINTPDLDKIKKIASFFNVTYDVLLDDDIELGHSEELAATDSSSREKSKKAESKYCDVFVSENEYDRDQSDFDRGYMSTKQNSTLISEVFLQCRRDETEQHLAELGYDEFYPFDTGAYSYFVVNHKQNLVGFYFDEGEQFVCPFENLVKFSYTYDSDVFLTDHHSHVTVVGGEVGAVGVTRTTSQENAGPRDFNVSLTYLDKDGKTRFYEFCVFAHPTWVVSQASSVEVMADMWRGNGDAIKKRLEKIKNVVYAICTKEKSTKSLPQVDVEDYRRKIEKTDEMALAYNHALDDIYYKSKYGKGTILWSLLLVASLVVVVVAACLYNTLSASMPLLGVFCSTAAISILAICINATQNAAQKKKITPNVVLCNQLYDRIQQLGPDEKRQERMELLYQEMPPKERSMCKFQMEVDDNTSEAQSVYELLYAEQMSQDEEMHQEQDDTSHGGESLE